MKIWYDNIIWSTGTTITSYSENPTYPCSTALTDTRLSRYYRSVGCSAEWVKFSLASSTLPVTDFFVVNHNVSSSATITLSANTADTWPSTVFSQSVTWGSDIWHNMSTTQTYKYWRLDIVDPGNADTYIQISKAFLGTSISMPGMDRSQKIPIVTTASVTRSPSGQIYGTKNIQYRAATIVFPNITDTEKKSIETFFAQSDIVIPFFMYIWPSAPTVEPLIYGRLTKAPEWTKVSGYELRWTCELSFEEVF